MAELKEIYQYKDEVGDWVGSKDDLVDRIKRWGYDELYNIKNLKYICSCVGVPATGTKDVLIQRLEEFDTVVVDSE